MEEDSHRGAGITPASEPKPLPCRGNLLASAPWTGKAALRFFAPLQIFFRISLTAAHTAAFIGTEGKNALSCEVIMLQKGIHCHWHCTPPVGVSHKNSIVILQTVQIVFQFWPCTFTKFLFGLIRAGIDVEFPLHRVLLYPPQINHHQ